MRYNDLRRIEKMAQSKMDEKHQTSGAEEQSSLKKGNSLIAKQKRPHHKLKKSYNK